MKTFFKPMLAASLVFFATSANALRIEISDNSTFSTLSGGIVIGTDDGGIGDILLDLEGALSTTAFSIGGMTVNIVTGFSSRLIDGALVNEIDLNSISMSSGPGGGTVYIRLTDTGFYGGDANYIAGYGGTTDGSVSFQSYVDTGNVAFGQGTLLADSGLISQFAFSGSDSGGLTGIEGPYSISIYATITHEASVNMVTTSFDYNVAIPEPATIGLLGIGLLGIGLTRRKKIKVSH